MFAGVSQTMALWVPPTHVGFGVSGFGLNGALSSITDGQRSVGSQVPMSAQWPGNALHTPNPVQVRAPPPQSASVVHCPPGFIGELAVH
jgi:hypothetical protein